MADLFRTKKEAQNFLDQKMSNSHQVQTEILMTFSDGIISQDHFSYFDFESNGNYNASILETKNGYKVDITFRKHSAIVLAAEVGDLDLFKEEIKKKQSTEALSLAFVMAIQFERLNILQFYYSEGYVKLLQLFVDPLITASKTDKINSFLFFLRKGMQLPIEILAQIFHNNSILIMKHIIQDINLSGEILQEKFQTPWTQKGLLKRDNECTKMFKTLLNAS